MLKKSITYTNPFTNELVTEEHYFYISKADIVEMEMEEYGGKYTSKSGEELTGMRAKLQQIIDSEDGKAIMAELKDFIRRSHCKRVGDRPVKSKEIWEEFSNSEAYSQLIFDLCTDADAAAEFTAGIIPRGLEEAAVHLAAKAQLNGGEGRTPAELTPEELENVQTLQQDNLPETSRVLTQTDIQNMDPEELKRGIANGSYKLS